MRHRLIRLAGILLAAFVIVAAPAAASAAPESSVGTQVTESATVPVAMPLDGWVSMGWYLNEEVCKEHGQQYVDMGLARRYSCPGYYYNSIFQLWIDQITA